MKTLLFLILFVFVFSNTATADNIWVHGNCLPGNPQYNVSDVPLLAPDWLVDDWTHVIAGCTGSTFLRSDKKLFRLCPDKQELCIILDDVDAVTSSGGAYWLVLKTDGTVWGWGGNTEGQLGDGTFNNYREEPVQALGLTNVLSVAIGVGASYALKEDGTVWAWGAGESGQLGDGNWGCTVFPPEVPTDCYISILPKQVPNLTDVKALFDGPYVIKNDGTVWAWGPIPCIPPYPSNQCCMATIPVQIEGLEDIVSVGDHVALKSDGTVWTWGDNAYGRLGIGTTDPDEDHCYAAVMVPTLSNVTWVGRQFAIKADGTLWGWGSHYGLGLPPNGNYAFPTPVQVKPLRNVKLASIFSEGFTDYAMVLAGDYDPVTITKVVPMSSPFRIKLKGTGFLSGLEVYPNTPPVLYIDGSLVDGLEVKLNKKGMLLFKSTPASTLKGYFPKGVTKTILIISPDGRISNDFQFTR